MVSIDELFRLNGNVALVTSGYGGISEAVCQVLVAAGAKVAIAGHDVGRAACAESLIAKSHDLRINSAGAPSGSSAAVFVPSSESGRSKDQ
jgi:NAD(P)-dependent dehydrogenase (short-subunit alcohol dehydrogenase family)